MPFTPNVRYGAAIDRNFVTIRFDSIVPTPEGRLKRDCSCGNVDGKQGLNQLSLRHAAAAGEGEGRKAKEARLLSAVCCDPWRRESHTWVEESFLHLDNRLL